jgi:hypothetical protein
MPSRDCFLSRYVFNVEVASKRQDHTPELKFLLLTKIAYHGTHGAPLSRARHAIVGWELGQKASNGYFVLTQITAVYMDSH